MSRDTNWLKGGKTDVHLNHLELAINEMPENLRAFSMSMRQLYAEYAVGTHEDAAVKFREIRDQTHRDAQVYIDVVIPLCKKLLSITDEFFDYMELDRHLWEMSVPTIKEDVGLGVNICMTINKIHKDIVAELQQREVEVRNVMRELKDLQGALNKKKHSLEKKSERKQRSAWKYYHLNKSQKTADKFTSSDLATAQAIAYGAQAQTQEFAINAVSQTLIPALKSFISNLDIITMFFWELEKQNLENFKVDMDKAEKVKHHCQRFLRCLPSVMTDLRAIPTEGTNQNYIDEWLEKQTNAIKENCTPEFAGSIIAILKEQTAKVVQSASSFFTQPQDSPKPYREGQYKYNSYV